MTFAITGRCARSGMLGVAVTTSSISVGARCPWVRAGVGAVSTQNLTDPLLGAAVLDAIQAGATAADALHTVMTAHAHADHRQVIAIDHDGNTASHAGAKMLGTHAVAAGDECIAAGNLLNTPSVVTVIAKNFAADDGDRDREHLAERLLRALEAGLAHGGEQGDIHSAAMLVADQHRFPLVDLRVDWHDRPLSALRDLWHAYRPQMHDYTTRALNPAAAPSYRVPGDL